MGINSIVISFPEAVELGTEDQIALDKTINRICAKWSRKKNDKIMWPACQGSKLLQMHDEGPVQFDDSVYVIDCMVKTVTPPDGVPCSHPGCLSHVTHPCEGCGRIAGGMMENNVYDEFIR